MENMNMKALDTYTKAEMFVVTYECVALTFFNDF